MVAYVVVVVVVVQGEKSRRSKNRLIKFQARLFFLVCYSVNVFLCCLISGQYLRPVSQAGIFSQAGLSLGRRLLSPATSCGLLSLSWPAGAGSFRFHLFGGRRRIRVLGDSGDKE